MESGGGYPKALTTMLELSWLSVNQELRNKHASSMPENPMHSPPYFWSMHCIPI
jgi:hypothetical protein